MSLSIRHWLKERNIEVADLGRPGAQVAGVAFRIAQDMEVKSLTPFDISALAEVLELPLRAAWRVIEPICQLSIGLLRILSQKKPLKRNEGTWITFQVAYLNALQGILEQESRSRRPWLERADVPAGIEADQPLNDSQLQALLKTLRPGRLSDSQAEQALTVISESFLVQQMNSTGIAWLIANGAEETEAKLITQRLIHGLPGYLLSVIAENPLPLAQLQKFVGIESLVKAGINPSQSWKDTLTPETEQELRETFSSLLPLELQRSHYRAYLLQSLSEPFLTEPFALKDLYISLKGIRSDSHSIPSLQSPVPSPQTSVDLMTWATAQLNELTTIAVIEAEPGAGKTSFCQMWAAHVAQNLYPSWMPVFIRLRDVTLMPTLEQTLDTAFPFARFTDTDGWLSSSHPPCLLIFDGLDELSGRSNPERDQVAFLDQLIQFQLSYCTSKGIPRHKIVLTTTPTTFENLTGEYRRIAMVLKSIPKRSPIEWRRIRIQPLDQEEFRQWFKQWSKLQSKSIAQAYFAFLKQGGVFSARIGVVGATTQELATLVRRPLMLYLLGVLHRDSLLETNIFQVDHFQVKLEIYDRICRWLLGESAAASGMRPVLLREGLAHACRSPEAVSNLLQKSTPQALRQRMQVAALKILQSGQHKIKMTIEETGLPEFFFRPIARPPYSSSQEGQLIEFSHSKLGDYLCAEEIAAQLKSLTHQLRDVHGEVTFAIDSPVQVAQHLYHLLGYGILSPKIEQVVIERLRREAERSPLSFSFLVLFARLDQFYGAYCRGRWLDEGIAHQVHAQLQALHNPLNVVQVDAAVGLNVFLLMCSIAQTAEISFWPCGNPSLPQEFDPDQLMTFISHTSVLSPFAFWQRAREHLSRVELAGANLNRAMLAGANLWQTNLSTAELMEARLSGANLQEANLSWANLVGADLTGANLTGAKLEGTDFRGANLRHSNLTLANLTHACLFQAQLDEAQKQYALLNGAIFSVEEFEAYIRTSAEPPKREIPQVENNKDTDDSTIYLLKSAEGEPVLPDSWEDNLNEEDETVLADESIQSETLCVDDTESSDINSQAETILVETPPNRN